MKEKENISKTIKNNYYQLKSFDTFDIKSDITEHPKTSHKLPKTLRKAEKADSNNSLYSYTKNLVTN